MMQQPDMKARFLEYLRARIKMQRDSGTPLVSGPKRKEVTTETSSIHATYDPKTKGVGRQPTLFGAPSGSGIDEG